MSREDPLIETLPCGLEVLVQPHPSGESYHAALAVAVGQYHDPPKLPGLAHLVEHLAFRGKNQSVMEAISEKGGQPNGFTAGDNTTYTGTGPLDLLELQLQFFANVLQPGECTANDLRLEKKVIQNELLYFGDPHQNPRGGAYARYQNSLYGDPVSDRTHRGMRRALKRVTPASVNEFVNRHYTPANARLAIVSPDPEATVATARRVLGNHLPPSETMATQRDAIALPRLPRIDRHYDGSSPSWLDITHLSTDTSLTARVVARLVSTHLAGGAHSVLYRRFRTENGDTYDVQMGLSEWLHGNGLQFFVMVPSFPVGRALRPALEEMERLRSEGFSGEQLESAVTLATRQWKASYEEMGSMSPFLAYEQFRGEESMAQPSRIAHALDSLQLESTNATIAELLSPQRRHIFLGGRLGLFAATRAKRMMKRFDENQAD